jgi:hypothetical protein
MLSRRDVLKTVAAMPLIAVAGCNQQSQPSGTASDRRFTLRLRIHGGYAYMLSQADRSITLGSIRDACHSFDHQMILVTDGHGEDAEGSEYRGEANEAGDLFWRLNGGTVFEEGVTAGPLQVPTATDPTSLGEPFAPEPFMDDAKWNDLVWLPQFGTAASGWEAKLRRTLALPSGTLAVLPPPNLFAKVGRWRYATGKRQALTDYVLVEAEGTGDALVLSTETDAGRKRIAIAPTNGTIELLLRHTPNRAEAQCFAEGDPVPHYGALYELTGAACDARDVPVFERIAGRDNVECEKATPGELCPPGVYLI